MQQENPFQDAVTWAADELVGIARTAKDLPVKERIALLKDICDRGGLTKAQTVNKRVMSMRFDMKDASAADGKKILEELEKLNQERKEIDERIKGAVAGAPAQRTEDGGAS